MQMLKKAAVILLAATMSLTMLTACGGGSGVGSAGTNEAYTMEMVLIKENDVAPKETVTEYITTNGTWSYIEDTYGTDKDVSLQNIKTGEYYIINPTAMKAYKADEAWDEGEQDHTGMNPTITTTNGTWTDENGKVYTTEIITTAYSNGKQIETWYCDGDKPAFIKYEFQGKNGNASEFYRVTQYSRTANESKLNLKNYTIVENEDDLGLNY